MKPKMKPAAKIFIAALIVAILFYVGRSFIGDKQTDKKETSTTDSVRMFKDSVVVSTPAPTVAPIEQMQTNTVVATSVPAQVSTQPSTNMSNAKKVEKKKENKPKEKKAEDRENLNVNF